MRQGEPQASLRAMRNDHAELWTRSEAQCAVRSRRPRSGWSPEDTERSEVRRGGTQPAEGEGCAKARNTAQALAQGCAKTRNDHAELRVGAKSEAAKRLKPRGAHEARALWAKQRGVSPMRQGEPQASLRAMRNDHAELWTRSEAKSAGAEHRTAKGECGAKRRKGG